MYQSAGVSNHSSGAANGSKLTVLALAEEIRLHGGEKWAAHAYEQTALRTTHAHTLGKMDS